MNLPRIFNRGKVGSSVAVLDRVLPELREDMVPAEEVKAYAVDASSFIVGRMKHWDKYRKASGGMKTPAVVPGFSDKVAKGLVDAGFVYFVPALFVERFRYSATFRMTSRMGPVVSKRMVRKEELLDSVRYSGDVPDSVLDKVEKAVGLEVLDFTIHSSKPLPVEYVPATVDPVIIGWQSHPMIDITSGRSMVIRAAKTHGIVIAIWNMEQEIDIL